MPLSYPPPIKFNDFTDTTPPSIAPVVKCKEEWCSLEAFGLVSQPGPPPGNSLPPNPQHAELDKKNKARVSIASGVDDLHIAWKFSGHQFVRWAKIEIFKIGSAQAIWTRTLDWPYKGARQEVGSTPFKGNLNDPKTAKKASNTQFVDTSANTNGFPDEHLSVEHAPYKLKMTINTDEEDVGVKIVARWIYLDVFVTKILLMLGDEDFIPMEPQQQDFGFNGRNKRLHTRMKNALQGGSLLAAAAPNVAIPLDGNIFDTNSAEWTTNAAFQAWQDLWRTGANAGPYIPIVATSYVRSFEGLDVIAPLAMGHVRFLWDWEGKALNQPEYHPLTRQHVAGAHGIHPGGWATGHDNSATGVGGKSGGAANLFKANDTGHQNYIVGGAGHFPFEMSACANRAGATFSVYKQVVGQEGKTGVVFMPSIIAGDRYKLTCYLAYVGALPANWDVNSTASHLANNLPYEVPQAKTGEFEVQRVVRVAKHWTMARAGRAELGTMRWDNLATKFFKPAGSTLDVSAVKGNPTEIPQNHFRQAFTTEVGLLPEYARLAFAPQNEQALFSYGIKFIEYNTFKTDLRQSYDQRLIQIGALGLPTHAQYDRSPEINRIGARLELFMELVRESPQNRGLPAPNPRPFMAIDDFNERMYGSAYGDTAHVTRIADVWLQNILATANVPLADQARIAGILAADPTAQGEQAAYDEILTLAGLENEDKYRSKCTKWADSMLKKIFAYISNQYLYDQTQTDGDGIQVFQVDFVDNFDGFLMSGWAFGTDSNRSHCPECAQALQPQDRHGRLCPTCNADLRTNSAIMTCIPWKHVAGFSPFTAISLKQKRDKYMVVSLMEGACPEVLVAHEMGHHLFMPHAPQGFAIPNPLPNTLVWRFLSFVFTRPTIAAQIAAATNTTGSHGPYHSTHNNACIMGYNFAEMPQLHFCYKCTLRLKGWSGAIVSALP